MSKTISPAALQRLQILYSQADKRFDLGSSREDRLAWAIKLTGRSIASFKDLYVSEGKQLIDALHASLQIKETSPSRPRLAKRDAEKAGTEGRHDQIHAETTMLLGNEQIFDLITAELNAIGWDQARLKAFLRSPRGPNNHRDTIRTLGDANRVHYALKRMVARARKEAA
jgi:hypothetical protein